MRPLLALAVMLFAAVGARAEDVPSPSDAALQHGILGAWARDRQACASSALTFSADGTYAVMGDHPATGRFQIKDGRITDSANGGTKTMALILQGDSLKFLDEGGGRNRRRISYFS